MATAGRTCSCGNEIHTFPWRGSGILVRVGRICAGTGFHIYDGTALFMTGFDCCLVHPTPSHVSQENVARFRSLCVLWGANNSCSLLSASEVQTFSLRLFFTWYSLLWGLGRVCAGTGFLMCAGGVCTGTGFVFFHFSVAREQDSIICEGRVCTATGFHIFLSLVTGMSRIPHRTARRIPWGCPAKAYVSYYSTPRTIRVMVMVMTAIDIVVV